MLMEIKITPIVYQYFHGRIDLYQRRPSVVNSSTRYFGSLRFYKYLEAGSLTLN